MKDPAVGTPPPKGTAPASDQPKDLPEDESKAPEGAPEKYEAFKLPEGVTMDEKLTDEVTGMFKEMNLSQPAAQKLVDFFATHVGKVATASHDAYVTMTDGWKSEVHADKEIGTGTELKPEVKATIGRAYDVLSESPDGKELIGKFKEAMDTTGVGSHPAFVKLFYRMSQKLTEGRPVTPPKPVEVKPPGQENRSPAQAMYPHLQSTG